MFNKIVKYAIVVLIVFTVLIVLTTFTASAQMSYPLHNGPVIGRDGVAGAITATGATPNLLFIRKDNLSSNTSPTVNEDSGDGYQIGSIWLDTTADDWYGALDVTVGAAVWVQFDAPVIVTEGDAYSGGTNTGIAYIDGSGNWATDGPTWDDTEAKVATSVNSIPIMFHLHNTDDTIGAGVQMALSPRTVAAESGKYQARIGAAYSAGESFWIRSRNQYLLRMVSYAAVLGHINPMYVKDDTGQVGIGTGAAYVGQLDVTTGAADRVVAIFKSYAAQSVNNTEWQQSDGTVVLAVDNTVATTNGMLYTDSNKIVKSDGPTWDGTDFTVSGATASGGIVVTNTTSGGAAWLTVNSLNDHAGTVWQKNGSTLWYCFADGDGDNSFHFCDSSTNRVLTLLASTSAIGINETSPGAQLQTTTGAADRIGQIVKLAAAQTANAFEVRASNDSVLSAFTKDGYLEQAGGYVKVSGTKYQHTSLIVSGAGFLIGSNGTIRFEPDYGGGSNDNWVEIADGGLKLEGYTSNPFIKGTVPTTDMLPRTLTVVGGDAYASAVTNINGEPLVLLGGNGASGSAGDADGANVTIDGGIGYGTGDDGNVVIAGTRGNTTIGSGGGVTYLGDGGTTNYAQFAADGELTLEGTARVSKEVQLETTALVQGSQGPDQTILGNYIGYSYDIGDDSVCGFEVPHDWDTTADMEIEIYYYINEAYAATKEVQWRVQWSACPKNNDEPVDAPTHTGTIDYGDDPIPDVAKEPTEVSGLIPAASLSAGDIVGVTLDRVALDDDDNPTADPVVIHVAIKYTSDKLGDPL